MVNMPEDSDGAGRGGDLLSPTKPGGGRNGLRHGHDVRKEEEKPGNMVSRVFGFYAIDGLALGFLAFQVAGALIHPLLIVAVVCLIIHFVRGRSGA
jgi:hypothetical protein